MKRTILFYGDSNTYGYDPADFYENRYPQAMRWTTLLSQQLNDTWNVIEKGMNGRKIPDISYDGKRIKTLLDILSENDIFAVMLGTNDILLTLHPNADEAVQKMRTFLSFLKNYRKASSILLIAPVHIGNEKIPDPLYKRYFRESRRMNAGFSELSEEFGTLYLDVGERDLELSADYVHLSCKGHSQLAKALAEYLQRLG